MSPAHTVSRRAFIQSAALADRREGQHLVRPACSIDLPALGSRLFRRQQLARWIGVQPVALGASEQSGRNRENRRCENSRFPRFGESR